MGAVIKTSRGRVLDLPVYISDMIQGEQILGTNAEGGRMYTSNDDQGHFLGDANTLVDTDDQKVKYISLQLIEDIQIETEKEEWGLAGKLRQVSDIEKDLYKK